MQKAIDILRKFGVDSEVKIVSAHRTPKMMFQFANEEAKVNGIDVIIAGAGGAAHLTLGWWHFNCFRSCNWCSL